ncbi:MAG: hypothetical protein NZM09_08620 [Ignavibacterium sp.]|nr:hypothetical protein [Ignavibacterium sp.]MDW8375746.1 hypothetical protein [Ignavibacteriales bacterium]
MSKDNFKVLLIDDRPNRQERFLDGERKLQYYIDSGVLTNIVGGTDFDLVKTKFENSNFLMLQDYDFIAIHRSAVNTEIRNQIISRVDKRKRLIFFSGGISESNLIKSQGNQLLLINSKTFYDNLILFLDACQKGNKDSLMQLAYGKNWELNLLYEALEKFYSLLNKESNISEYFYEFEIEIPNEYIKLRYFKDCEANTIITSDILKSITSSILNDINNIL